MKIIKITTPWNHNYLNQVSDKIKSQFTFEINNDCDEADYWIIWGGLTKSENVKVLKNNVFYLTDECHDQRFYSSNFLSQFINIFSVLPVINGIETIQIHEPTIWYFNKHVDDLNSISIHRKTKNISIVSSDLTNLIGHKKRFAFVNKLIGHFKDKIEYFGRGFNEIESKWDALYDFKYSIAIENNVLKNYFSEKLTDCFLSYAVPIYYGCPNILDFYPHNSHINIDIDNHVDAFRVIEKVIEETPYEQMVPRILESRNLYLSKYHFIPMICNLINKYGKLLEYEKSSYLKIFPESEFITDNNLSHIPSSKIIREILCRLKNKVL
jgi:hypothetical protein